MPHSEQAKDGPPPLPVLRPVARRRPEPRPAWWVRGILVLMAAAFVTVFYVATKVKPYGPAGEPMRMASHESLGLPPCNFKQSVGIPCPSCGMTTSFAMLVRGDVWNSLRANWVGTLLAVVLAVSVPWALWTAVRGRYLWVRRLEFAVPIVLGTYVILMLMRWVGVVILQWL